MKILVRFLSVALLVLGFVSTSNACLPQPGAPVLDIKVNGKKLGTYTNTINPGLASGSIEVKLVKKAKQIRLVVKAQQPDSDRNKDIAFANTDKAKIDGQYLAGGESLEIYVDGKLAAKFAVRLTRGMGGCGSPIEVKF